MPVYTPCPRCSPRRATQAETLVTATILLQLSPLPRRRLSEWPTKPTDREDGHGSAHGGDLHRSGVEVSKMEDGQSDAGVEACAWQRVVQAQSA